MKSLKIIVIAASLSAALSAVSSVQAANTPSKYLVCPQTLTVEWKQPTNSVFWFPDVIPNHAPTGATSIAVGGQSVSANYVDLNQQSNYNMDGGGFSMVKDLSGHTSTANFDFTTIDSYSNGIDCYYMITDPAVQPETGGLQTDFNHTFLNPGEYKNYKLPSSNATGDCGNGKAASCYYTYTPSN